MNKRCVSCAKVRQNRNDDIGRGSLLLNKMEQEKENAVDAEAVPLIFSVTRLVFIVIAHSFPCKITHEVHGCRCWAFIADSVQNEYI